MIKEVEIILIKVVKRLLFNFKFAISLKSFKSDPTEQYRKVPGIIQIKLIEKSL